MFEPVVSVIVPVYNSESFIIETLESVRRQTFTEWECIVVDDCSTDNSLSLVNQYIKESGDDRFKVIRLEENSGVAVARNRAIDLSRGKFCAFLDSDDIWKKNKLKVQVDFMVNKDVLFSYSAYYCFSEKGSSNLIKVPPKVSRNDILKTCSIYTSTVVVSKSVLGVGMPEHLRKRQDYVTWLNILKDVAHAIRVDTEEGLMMYRLRDDSISANKVNVAKIQWSIYRKELNLNMITTMYYFLFYVSNGVLKRLGQVKLRS
ncbi:glycosyltransferase family 2 protein [Schleiferiaceae bacterium]|nr:glycosyltransferase family 2 protein [Schleiferiaceae bacterium]